MLQLKSKLFFIASIFSVVMLFACYTSHSGSGETKLDAAGQGKNEILLRVMMQGLNSAHFQPEKLDDNYSKKVYDLFLQRLDFNKKFLLQSDIDQLQKYHTQIDDQVQIGSYEFLDASTKIFNVRSKESKELYKEILAKPFNFETEESTELDPEKLKFPKDKAEQREAWRKYLKYQTLVQMTELVEMQEKAQAKK